MLFCPGLTRIGPVLKWRCLTPLTPSQVPRSAEAEEAQTSSMSSAAQAARARDMRATVSDPAAASEGVQRELELALAQRAARKALGRRRQRVELQRDEAPRVGRRRPRCPLADARTGQQDHQHVGGRDVLAQLTVLSAA